MPSRLVAAAVVALIVSMGAGPVATGQEADDGLRFLSGWTFRIDPAAGVVHVSVRLDITNEAPPRFGAGFVETSFLPETAIPLLAEATAIAAVRERDGVPLPVRVEPTDLAELSVAIVDVQPDLQYQDNTVIRITYDLPPQAPRSPTLTRVNEAFAALIPVFFGDPGLTDIDIVVPDGYDVEFIGGIFDETEGDGEVVYSARQIPNPDTFDAAVVFRDDDRLTSRTFRAGDHDVVVRSWPGDEEWAEFVESTASEAIPAMIDLIGEPLPVDELQITETVTPYLYGYAGWYDDIEDSIEIGEELDEVVVVHELAHAWWNSDWFEERWIGEAFAEEYASRALAQMGRPLTGPGAAAPDDPGRLRLVDWGNPDLLDSLSEAQEAYGYNASWVVARTITDEIGMEAMAEVIDAVADGTIAYRGDPDPEQWSTSGGGDWRRLLDLLQEIGRSQLAEQVFTDLVVSEADLPELAERAAARTQYVELGTVGDGWTAPLAVRRLLGLWRFDTATETMAVAREVLEARADVAAIVADVDVELTGMEVAYESAGNPGALAAVDDEWTDGARELAAAAVASDDADGLLASIGLLGSDGPDAALEEAIVAFEDGDLDGARESAAEVHVAVDEAGREGHRRVGALVATVLLVLVARRVVPAYAAQRRGDAG